MRYKKIKENRESLDWSFGMWHTCCWEDLSLDEPDLEAMLFLDDGSGGEENETIRVWQ